MDDSIKREEQEADEFLDSALIPSELHILVTEADTNGYEISKMKFETMTESTTVRDGIANRLSNGSQKQK